MTVWVKTGTFTTPASGTTVIDVGYHGDTPVAIHMWGSWANSNDANRADCLSWHGFAAGGVYRSLAITAESAGTINNQRQGSNTSAILIMDPADDSLDVLSSSIAFNTSDVTISYGAFTAGFVIHYTIFGGSDVTASVREHTVDSSPHTGVGFTSDLIIFCCNGNAIPASSVHAYQSFGVATDDGGINQWCHFAYMGDGDLDTIGSALAPAFNAGQYNVDFPNWTTTITAIGSDGYTWTGTNGDELISLCLNFNGAVTVDVGSFTKSTSGAPATQALPTLNSVPQMYFLSTSSETTTTIATDRDCRISHGAYDHFSQAGNCSMSTRDLATGTDAHSRSNNSETLQHSQNLNVSGVQSSATSQQITDTTPELEWSPNTSAAEHIGYYAIGQEATPVKTMQMMC